MTNLIAKYFSFIFLLVSCFTISCSEKAYKSAFTEISNIPKIELELIKDIKQNPLKFTNKITSNEVEILNHIDKTGFHFYNSIKFKTKDIGVMVGGTGLRTRITKNGGQSWNQYSFSGFANPFHSSDFNNNSLFIVGESNFIFKTDDLGENWTVFDTQTLFKEASFPQFKYYKIQFFDDNLGYIAGDFNGKFILLKTLNGGLNWEPITMNGLEIDEYGISDFKILSKKEIIIVTGLGKCYKSLDSGNNWKLLFKPDSNYMSLNAIDFKDSNNGYIGGINGAFYKTIDGGKNWTKIKLPQDEKGNNISHIKYIKNQIFITTSKVFSDKERSCFVYTIDENTNSFEPFLTKNTESIYFTGDAHYIDVLENEVYILDRNNLYKTLLTDF